MKTEIYIPCKCGHYEGVHRDPVCHFNACEECSSKRTVHINWGISIAEYDGSKELIHKVDPENICSGYKPMDGLEYIEWLGKQKESQI